MDGGNFFENSQIFKSRNPCYVQCSVATEEREVVSLKETRKRVRTFFQAKKEIRVSGPAGSRDPTSPVVPSFASGAPGQSRAWRWQSG